VKAAAVESATAAVKTTTSAAVETAAAAKASAGRGDIRCKHANRGGGE
jgi:hypothetical protein